MKKFTFVLFGAIASAALAHPGPRVWIGNEGNQLITYQKSGTDYVHEQVFSQPLENILDNIWTTDFPGYEVRSNGNVASGPEIGIDFTGPLLRYTGSGIGFTELSAPTDPKLAITNEIDETVFSSTGVAPGYLFFYPSAPGDHAHLFAAYARAAQREAAEEVRTILRGAARSVSARIPACHGMFLRPATARRAAGSDSRASTSAARPRGPRLPATSRR